MVAVKLKPKPFDLSVIIPTGSAEEEIDMKTSSQLKLV